MNNFLWYSLGFTVGGLVGLLIGAIPTYLHFNGREKARYKE